MNPSSFPRSLLPMFAALLLGLLPTRAQEASFVLSDALGRIERAPVVVQAKQKFRQAEADLRLSQAQAGAKVDVGGQVSYSWLNPVAANPVGVGLNLGVNVPLGTSSAAVVALRQAELNLESNRISLRQTQSDLARRVVQLYGQVLVAESQRTQNTVLLELAQKQTSVLEEQQRLGSATATQVLNSRLSLSTAQQNLNRSESDWRDKRSSLAGALGLAALPGRPALPNEAQAVPTLEQVLPKLEQCPAVAQAVLALAQAQLQLEKNLRGFSLSLGLTSDQFGANLNLSVPDFNTQVTVNYQPLTANPSTSGTTLTLGANIPIWDGGTTDASRDSAIIGIENAQSQLEQVRQDTRYQLESAIELMRLDAQNLLLQQEAKTVAEGSLNEVKQRLALGAVSPLDELAARAGLEAAQGNLVAAQTRLLEDRYQLLAVLGLGGI
jgi:outer membrane protein TolC